MKENGANISKKKKWTYAFLALACVLLLAAATVLTVYFVSKGNSFDYEISDPVDDSVKNDDNQNSEEPKDDGNKQDDQGDETNQDDQPTGGETVTYVSPLENAACSVEYDSVYTNLTLNQIRIHKGVDYAADEGTAVYAIAAGIVESVSCSEELGNLITIDHGDGLKSYYRFVEPVESLSEGDSVTAGQQIATVAAAYGTEYKDGTHLHFELKSNGDWVDPSTYFEVTYEEK